MFHLFTLPTSFSRRISSTISNPERQRQSHRHSRALVRTFHPCYPAPLPFTPQPPRVHLQLHPRPHQYPFSPRRPIGPRYDRTLRRRHRTSINSQSHACQQNPHRPWHRHTVHRLHLGAETAAAVDAAFVLPMGATSGDDHRNPYNPLRRLAHWTAPGGFEEWHQ